VKTLRKYRAMPDPDRRLLRLAAGLVVASRVALWLLPYRLICRAFCITPMRLGLRRGVQPARIAWAVDAAARYVPGASCLTRALAGLILARSAGHPADLRIGVRKSSHKPFEAHAWLEVGGVPILGDGELSTFTPLMIWHGEHL